MVVEADLRGHGVQNAYVVALSGRLDAAKHRVPAFVVRRLCRSVAEQIVVVLVVPVYEQLVEIGRCASASRATHEEASIGRSAAASWLVAVPLDLLWDAPLSLIEWKPTKHSSWSNPCFQSASSSPASVARSAGPIVVLSRHVCTASSIFFHISRLKYRMPALKWSRASPHAQ